MIRIENLIIRQGRFSLEKVSFEIPRGAYGVLMGKTGCGKTSLLEAIAGLRKIQQGSIWLGGVEVSQDPPAARGIGYVPQDGALFRTMTVREHLGFGLEIRRVPRDVIHRKVEELASWLGLSALLDRYPQGLSGGESQRVALGRALSFEPRYLLLDEPLSSLDEETREQLMEILDKLRQSRSVTVLHVTHQRVEADRLGDVRLRLENGQIREESKRS